MPDADALDGFDDYNPPEVPCCRPDPLTPTLTLSLTLTLTLALTPNA